jgi:hypothetical protein
MVFYRLVLLPPLGPLLLLLHLALDPGVQIVEEVVTCLQLGGLILYGLGNLGFVVSLN